MSTKISHSGVIESIDGDRVQVRIVQTSACSACKVAGYCHASESKEKLVDVWCDVIGRNFAVGQSVIVVTSGSVAVKALFWAFGLPFLILVSVLFFTLFLTDNEGLAAFAGLVALLPYYMLLWVTRNRMRQELSFQIE